MSDKAEESTVGPENQMKRRGEPMSPPPSKRMLSMALLSVKQEGEGASHPRGLAMSLEDDDPKVTVMSVSGEAPDQLPLPVEISAEMKHQLRREIQRYGQKYERIFKFLKECKDLVNYGKKFVLYSVKETARSTLSESHSLFQVQGDFSSHQFEEVMSEKGEESAVGPKSQVKSPGKSITPSPIKKRLSMRLLSVEEEGEGASHAGGSAVSMEDDGLKVTATSVSGDMPDQLPIPVKINTEIKEQLKMEIRQLGGKYERISKLLEGVQGPPEVQKNFVVYAMKEAARFKRQDLVSRLGNLLEKIEYEEFLNKDEDSQVF
ncbi:integrator complex subunit 6-like [Ursus arctos]|uniref:integrator complex subunit 6-like n=1 Tax=Ursus arctos TaxID=9644 RepID=UPI002548D21A|nr:integrator complex subunit 6-like [Ursus arctos]